MELKVKLYGREEGRAPRASPPVVTVTIGDRKVGAHVPKRVVPEARFFLESVESNNDELKRRVIGFLTADSVTVRRAAASQNPAVRMRGAYRAQEPYGTAVYWRAALGRLQDVGLESNQRDYSRALRAMENGERHPLLVWGRDALVSVGDGIAELARRPLAASVLLLAWAGSVATVWSVRPINERVVEVRVPVPFVEGMFTNPIVEFGFEPKTKGPVVGSKGPTSAIPVVNSGERFTLAPRVATNRRHGWLYQIDTKSAALLKRLKKKDGALAEQYSGRFDNTAGHELFVIVLADAEPETLGREPGTVAWLTSADLDSLQVAAARNEAARIERVLHAALERAGLPPGSFQVRVQHIIHIDQDEP